MEDKEKIFSILNRKDSIFLLVLGIILVFFSLTSLYSFLLFHTLSELFSIVIAAAIFIIAWNSRDYIDNKYLLFIGIAYLFIGGIDLLHTLAYKGMNIFAGFDANLPTQLWIAGRYLEAATLIAAALLISRKVDAYKELAVYTAIFSALLITIFTGLFPVCYIEGQGLTAFKIGSEYLICLMLALAIYLLYRRKENFEPGIFNLVIISIFFTILSELAFTFYVSVYDFSNLTGHLFKIVSFALIYYALVESGIRRPQEIIFRELSLKEKELTKEKDKLEMYLEVAGVMFLVLDVKGIVRLINPKGCEILGYEESEIVGMDFIDNIIPPEKRDEGLRMFSVAMTGDIESYISLEYDVLTKNGDIRTLLWQSSLIRDEEGNITGTLSSGEDITSRKQAESLLQRTQFAFDHSPDEIYYVNSEGQLIYANLRARESFGIESDFPITKTIFDINPEITQDQWKDIWSEILKKGRSSFESVHRHPDGTSYPVDILEYLITHDGVRYSCTIARDITERKNTQEVLRKSEAHLRSLLQNIPDLIWLKDPDGIYLSCNTTFEQFFGAKESEIVGKSDYDFIDKVLADSFRKNDINAMKAGKPTINEEWITFASDGHRAYLETIKTPVNDENGVLIGVLGIGRDITERKEAEDALLESKAQLTKLIGDLKIIIENAPAMIWYKDTENNFVRVNPAVAKTFGRSVKEIEGKNASYLFPSLSDAYYKDDLEVITSKKPKLGIIEPLTTAAGESLWVQTDKIPLSDENGNVYGVLLFTIDITERKKAEDALKEVNKKLNMLSSITRHDILNQITVAAGYMEMLQLDKAIPKDTKAEKYIDNVSVAIETIKKEIIFTGYYKDLGEQAPQWFDVGSIITATQESFRFDGVKLRNDIKNTEIFADPLFEKVIFNLIDNAIKHGETISEISFFTDGTPDELVIVCEDDGMGIPSEAKEKIFKREYFKNSGLGLFLSREILAITGLIITETGIFGEGARFEIHVPKGKYREISPSDDERK